MLIGCVQYLGLMASIMVPEVDEAQLRGRIVALLNRSEAGVVEVTGIPRNKMGYLRTFINTKVTAAAVTNVVCGTEDCSFLITRIHGLDLI